MLANKFGKHYKDSLFCTNKIGQNKENQKNLKKNMKISCKYQKDLILYKSPRDMGV